MSRIRLDEGTFKIAQGDVRCLTTYAKRQRITGNAVRPDPIRRANSAAAPATVCGERAPKNHWETGKVGETQRPASQETDRAKLETIRRV